MAVSLDWSLVIDRPTQKPEFGACHEHYAWRPHKKDNHKFANLDNAFNSSTNSICLLLQHPRGNQNARNYQQRGRALFAAVWYPNTTWAILCDQQHATLIPRVELAQFTEITQHDPRVEQRLRQLLADSPQSLHRPLNSSFYCANIARNSTP